MNRSFPVLCMLASTLGLTAAAQTPAPSASVPNAPSSASAPVPVGPAKIAIIAFQPAVAQTNEGQRNFAELRKKFEPKQTALKRQADELDALKKDLQAKGDTLSDTARAAQLKTIDEKEKALQRTGEDAQNEYQTEAGETYSTLAQKVYEVLQNYAQQQGYTVVMDVTQTQQAVQPILWAAESTNITKAIIDAYNAKSGVPPPTAASSSGAASTTPHTTPRSTAPATSAAKPQH
jgi:outer membrane protein